MNPPILIVGAGRSGTKLLRDILGSASDTVNFPREINYIWRYGNSGFPTDELQPVHARAEVKRYIRGRFQRFMTRSGANHLVEKTCANSLRIEFVREIFPEAHIIHLIRDGRAVAESARRRWQSSPSIFYLLEKFQWVPIPDMPRYFFRYLGFQLNRLRGSARAPGSWGPRFVGIDQLVEQKTLLEVCGYQWKACVRNIRRSLPELEQTLYSELAYEDLVKEPVESIRQLFRKLGLQFTERTLDLLNNSVTDSHLGKWRDRLDEQDLKLLLPVIEDEMEKWGYTL